MISLPAKSILYTALLIEKPSNTGETWQTPSPQSKTRPVERPYAYRLRTAYVWKKRLGVPNVSKNISAVFTLLE